MSADLRTISATVLLISGTFFFFTGTVGILRMPDVFTRLHAAAKADSLGAGLWLLGMALICGSRAIAVKLVILTLFIWVTGPTAAHTMARASYRAGIRLDDRTTREIDPRAEGRGQGEGTN